MVYVRIVTVLLVIFVCGCAPTRFAPCETIPFKSADQAKGWFYAFFKIRWDGEAPAWHTDLAIAHRVMAPVLERYSNEITLWRFHRRAAPDETGHRFSLTVYCPPATARKVFSAIDSSVFLEDLKSAGIVAKVTYEPTDKVLRPIVEGTSDRNWSKPIQKAWPWFIMGVSETWLDLIDRYANDGRPKPLTLDEAMEFYREIDEAVRESWKKEGAHAFLHHLNALFGYGPLDVRGTQVRF